MTEFDTRGDLDAVLREYLVGERDATALRDWLHAQPLDRLEEPLRADVAVLRETAEQVVAHARDESELRQLASGLIPQDLG